jgi:hypothetical protein
MKKVVFDGGRGKLIASDVPVRIPWPIQLTLMRFFQKIRI